MRPSFPRHPVHVAAAAFAVALSASASAGVIINEIDADQTGTDTTEFIELYDGGAGNTSLDGMFLVLFNGSNNSAYMKINLAGKSTNAGGFFLVASSGTEASDRTVLAPGSGGWLQNGSDSSPQGDAVALFQGDFALVATSGSATSATALPPELTLVDAVVYDGGSTLTANNDVLLTGLNLLGQTMVFDPQVGSVGRVPDGGDPFQLGFFTVINPPTPGALNSPAAALALSFTASTFSEAAGAGASTGTVTRTGPTTAAVTVTLTSSDPTEATVPATVEIPAGQASATFAVAAVNDLWQDGPQSVTVLASAVNFQPTSDFLTVDDDGDPVGLVVNEIHGSGRGDANLDGDNGTFGFDEFVEIVNAGATAVDLTGYKLLDAAALAVPSQVRHVFPPGTVLGPGCALVVFGGGKPAEGMTEAFGNAWIQKANGSAEFGLSLNDSGDLASVQNAAGVEVAGGSYPNIPTEQIFQSLTRNPDVTGTTLISHEAVNPSAPFSPGTKADGTPFCELTQSLTASLSVSTVAENAGNGAATLTITRPAPLTAALLVSVLTSDATEATPASSTVTIPAGEASVTVPINAVDDTAQDGDAAVVITAIGAGLLNGTANLLVTDDADTPLTTLYINELDSDQDGTDAAEFVELYDGGLGNRPLDGFVLVFFNGANNTSYLTIDLAGHKTNAQGYFVAGNSGVANVGAVFAGNTLQNGPDAVALYKAPASSFPNGTAAANFDLIDAVVYGTTAADGLIAALLPGGGVHYNEGGSNNSNSLSRVPDATSAFGAMTSQAPTPGLSNGSTPASGYTQWAAGFPGVGAPGVDSDNDGYPNVLEYALGTDPLNPGSVPVPTVTLQGGKPRLTLTKGTIASADAKLTYLVEASTSLGGGSWSTTDVAVTPSGTSLTADYTGSAPTAFLRVTVTLAP